MRTRDKPVLLLAVDGGDHHALVLDHALRPLFAFLPGLAIPVGIFGSSGDFDGTTLLSPRVYGRIELALSDVAELLRSRSTRGARDHRGQLIIRRDA